MDSQRTGDYDAGPITAPYPGDNQVISETPAVRRNVAFGPSVAEGENVMPARNRVQWGPIMAGLLTTIATMLVLTVLGLAIGLSVFEPTSDGSNVGTAATIWSALSALVAFMLGGWVAGKTAAVWRHENAILNGLMVGAAALALILWLTSMGVGNLLGGLGSNIGDIARVGTEQVTPGEASNAAEQARQTAVNNYDDARNSAWGTLVAMVLALGAAAVGGYLGHQSRGHHTDDRATYAG